MESVEESAAHIVYRLATGFRIDYSYLEAYARKHRQEPKEVLKETLKLCRKHRINAASLKSTVPKEKKPYVPEEGRERFPLKGLGRADKRVTTGGYAKERRVLSRMDEREKWAKEHGYSSWARFQFEEHAKGKGYKSAAEYHGVRTGHYADRYLALLANLYRAGVPEAERLANLIMAKRYHIPRKRLAEKAKELAKLPLLPPAKKRRMLDASLRKDRKRFGK